MNIKKILSSALVLVMVFTALIAVMPTKAAAAYDTSAESSTYTSDEIKAIVKAAQEAVYNTAEEMLDFEWSQGYLDKVTTANGEFSMFVNRYTGVFYYKNNLTGQILTSNPYEIGAYPSISSNLLSQIKIDYTKITTNEQVVYYSTEWAANYAQISTDYIKGGIRVSYTLGDTTARFLLPGRITAEKFESLVIIPAIRELEGYLKEYGIGEYDFLEVEGAKEHGCISSKVLKKYLEGVEDEYEAARKAGTINYAQNSLLAGIKSDIILLISKYSLKNPEAYKSERYPTGMEAPALKDYYSDKNLDIVKNATPIYVYDTKSGIADQRINSGKFQKYADGYTFSEMYADEAACGYVDNSEVKPVFRCALEYSFNEDGTLSVRLPASSVTYDESIYAVTAITPLMYFGAGDMSVGTNDGTGKSGYIFYPDGSGTVVDFDDFYAAGEMLIIESDVYGSDFAYATITGEHREQVTMPVYGLVNKTPANATSVGKGSADTVMNGYFAIIEEGSSLARLGFETGGASHKYASVYCSYTPSAFDEFEVIGASNDDSQKTYLIVSDCKYTGSYVTRIVMLSDEKLGETAYGKDKFYPATYVGMANYYRNYLKGNGTLKALENLTEDLPLYIEALGSMKINAKFLTFPITKSIPLTTFGNISDMYGELKLAGETYEAKAKEYDALAAKETDPALKAQYEATAAAYRKVINITNVNFRLTGFGNGGMYATYPTKVRWDKACGGAGALNELIKYANGLSWDKGEKLGIYPEYDFMYINYTATFDGISVRGNVSKMVDNRYASKQTYNQISREWETDSSLVINPSALENLYSIFTRQYKNSGLTGVSVSTLGSDLNSNFDEDNPSNRNDAVEYVDFVLGSMKNNDNLDIMTDAGNIYSVKYASHILNAAIDSSHFRYASYAVPFTGMILHGYVNYTGAPLNYAGTPSYNILRSIENGAALYYILCYQNTSYMKDDDALNQYYGVDYKTWFEDIAMNYAELNAAIGDLQSYQIVDHKIIIGERVISDEEVAQNYRRLKAEILEMIEAQLADAVADGYEYLETTYGPVAAYGKEISVVVDEDTLMAQISELLNLTAEQLKAEKFDEEVKAITEKYETTYASTAAAYTVDFKNIEYNSKYSFITDSYATADDYVKTDYTSDVGNIALVTYYNGTDTVQFILNYNIYSVTVNLDGTLYEVEKFGYTRIG